MALFCALSTVAIGLGWYQTVSFFYRSPSNSPSSHKWPSWQPNGPVLAETTLPLNEKPKWHLSMERPFKTKNSQGFCKQSLLTIDKHLQPIPTVRTVGQTKDGGQSIQVVGDKKHWSELHLLYNSRIYLFCDNTNLATTYKFVYESCIVKLNAHQPVQVQQVIIGIKLYLK